MAQTIIASQMPVDQSGPNGDKPLVEAEAPGNGRYTVDALEYEAKVRQAKGDVGFSTLPRPRALTHAGVPFLLGPKGGTTNRR